jgi:hypothetical protein
MRMLLLAALVAAQQVAGSVVAVTIDTAVVDSAGRPIPGLAAGDFSVELDGLARRVVAVTYFPSGAPMTGAIGPSFDAVAAAPPVYRVVVQPPDGTVAGQEFAVAVSVTRPGARIQTPLRAAAMSVSVTGTPKPPPTSSTPVSNEDRLRAAISAGRVESGLPIQIGRATRRDHDTAKIVLDVHVEIGSAQAPLTALLGIVDPRGAIRSAAPPIEPAAARHRVDLSLPLEPGTYKLRFAVVDAAGAMGAIESPVNAQLTKMGAMLASDLLRWTTDPNGRRLFLLDEVPSSLAAIGATLELYPTPGTPPPNDLLVKMEFAGIERIVTPEPRDGALIAEAEFPLDRLSSGSYIVRATVTSATTALGSVSTTLVKR